MGRVTLSQLDGVAILTLDAPPMNALTRSMVSELGELLVQCDADPTIRALVLRGSGRRAFCAGTDLDELQRLIAEGPALLEAKFLQDEAVFGALASFRKPTVAAIDAAAIGGGLELALCCDFVVAAESAKLALPEIHLGVFPGSGGTVRVTRRIGAHRARRMMLLGEAVDAATALAWGLVDEIAAGFAEQAALSLARRLAEGPALAIQACKASIQAAVEEGEEPALATARSWAMRVGFTADAAEGLSAFLQKRRPRFADQLA